MINFFRKNRQKLLTENKFSKYLIYAIGEILLVVIGILIALYINKQTIRNEQDKEFIIAIEQIYTHLHSAKELEKWDIGILEEQLEVCRNLRMNMDSISDIEILRYVYFLDWMPGTGFKLSNFDEYLGKIEFEPDDNDKSSMVFHLNQFFLLINGSLEHDYNNFKSKYFEPILIKNNIPISSGQADLSIKRAEINDSPLISYYAIDKIKQIRNSQEFHAALASTETRIASLMWTLEYRKNENEFTREMLLSYEPNLKLRYDKLSIAGNALHIEVGNAMTLIDDKNGTWEIHTELKDGSILFKTEYAQYFNWGDNGINEGKLRFWGNPIEVKKGNYLISINLERMTYQIEKK
ncbi:MAG: hypothetical protein U9R60_18750 [Bacteroidota bacterium]|nr:hypothetical protein [Bacteroidota bacterium]